MRNSKVKICMLQIKFKSEAEQAKKLDRSFPQQSLVL